MFTSPSPSQAGVTFDQPTDLEVNAQYVASGSSDARYVESALGTRYELTNISDTVRLLSVNNRSSVNVIGQTSGSDQVLRTYEPDSGVDGDIFVDRHGTEDYSTIQDAVDAANDTDTIIVERATYEENVNVTKNVTLIAEHGTVIEDKHPNEDVFHFAANATGAGLTNFIIDADPIPNDGHYARHGVYVGGDNIQIIGNQIKNASSPTASSSGVFVNSSTARIQHNNVTDNEYSVSFGDNARSPQTCSNNFDSSFGGGVTDSSKASFVKNNDWSDGVPSDLVASVLAHDAATAGDGTAPTDDSVYNTLSAADLNQSGATIETTPFSGSRLTPSADCQQLLAFTNTGDESMDILNVSLTLTINGEPVDVRFTSPSEFAVDEPGYETRTGEFVCAGCRDGTYDPGDSVVLPHEPLQEESDDPIYFPTNTTNTTNDSSDDTTTPENNTTNSVTVERTTMQNGFPVKQAVPAEISYDSGSIEEVDKETTETSTGGADKETTVTATEEDPVSVELGRDFNARVGDEIVVIPVVTGSNGTTTYDWTFGDGTTATGSRASHFYTEAGDYQLCVDVTDEVGDTDSDCVTVTINEEPDTVTKVKSGDTSLQDQLDNTSSGDVLTIPEGTYGDLTITTPGLTLVGEGDVTIGTTHIDAQGVTAKNLNFNDGLTITAPGTRLYDSSVANEDDWALGIEADNTYAQNATLTGANGVYVTPGLSDVRLDRSDVTASETYGVDIAYHGEDIVVDSTAITAGDYGIERGHATDATFTNNDITAPTPIQRIANQPPNPQVNANLTTVLVDEDVYLDVAGSTDPEDESMTFAWDLNGDGTPDQTGPTAVTSFPLANDYPVTLTATDRHGATASTTYIITATLSSSPTANLTVSRTTTNVSEPLSFDAYKSTDPDGQTLTAKWDFDGDGVTDTTGAEVHHRFDTAGERTVTLTIEDPSGLTDSTSQTINVTNPPTADAGGDREVPIDSPFQFTANNSSDEDGYITAYEWDFDGDGTIDATGETAHHTYTETGQYTARLLVTDNHNITTSDTITVKAATSQQLYSNLYGFEAGLDAWETPGDRFELRTDRVYNGTYSGGSATQTSRQVLAERSLYENGTQITTMSFLWQEGGNSNGGGLALINDAGEREVAVATGNPQWFVSTGDGGMTKVRDDDGDYGNWRRVTLKFNWKKDSYTYRIEKLNGGAYRTGTNDLGSGKNIKSLRILNNDGGNFGGGNDFRMWFDDIRTSANAIPKLEGPDLATPGQTRAFNGSGSYGPGDLSYRWDFDGDGKTDATGATATYAYDEVGNYTASLTVVSQTNDAINTTTQTVEVREPHYEYAESFEDGLRGWWTAPTEDVSARTSRTYDGDQSIGHRGSVNTRVLAKDVVYPGGDRPTELTYYYNERSNSNGGGLRVVNSDGEYEAGFATDNPEWEFDDADGRTQVYSGGGYGRWVKVNLRFDWQDNTYHYRIEDLRNNHVETGTRNLSHGKDIEEVRIEDYSGGWSGNSDFGTWFDDIKFGMDPTASFDAPTGAANGEQMTFNAEDSNARKSLQYDWDFNNDGVTDATGKQVQYAYANSGEHTVTLTVTDQDGVTDTTTQTVKTFAPYSDFHDSFDDGDSDGWTTYSGLGIRSDRSYSGDYSLGQKAGNEPQLLAENVVYPGGNNPVTFSYYYRENSNSHGGGMRLVNSDGNYEAGFATDNPEWHLSDGDGRTKIYNGDGYGQWVHVQFTFDWKQNTYDYRIEDLQSGHVETGTRDLKHGKDIETLHVENYNQGWDGGDVNFYTWIDDVSLDMSPVPEFTQDNIAETGTPTTFNATPTHGTGALTYEWDTDGDGSVEATGETISPTYDTTGEKTVTLTVTTEETGESVSTSNIITVTDNIPRSCKELLDNNPGLQGEDGYYSIDPDGEGGDGPREAYCDMTTDGGGWTRVIDWNPSDGSTGDEFWSNTTVEDGARTGTKSNKVWYSANGDRSLLYENSIDVPNNGEVRATIDYYGESMEASASYFYVTNATGGTRNLVCGEDYEGHDPSGYSGPQPSRPYNCANNNDLNMEFKATYVLNASSEMTSYRWAALQADNGRGDRSHLYRQVVWVR